jgi:TP901-1 family phage major tail protein
MAQTPGKMNGTDLAFYLDGALIGHATEGSISISEEPRDTTTKESGAWRELAEGLRSWSGSTTHFHAEDATVNVDDLYAHVVARTAVDVVFSTEQTGDKRWSGTVRVTSIEVSAGVEDNVGLSVSFEGTGPLTYETIT